MENNKIGGKRDGKEHKREVTGVLIKQSVITRTKLVD